jgi:hypothetical protein
MERKSGQNNRRTKSRHEDGYDEREEDIKRAQWSVF